MESQTSQSLLKDHVEWASEQNFCEKCIRPWVNRECSCGNSNHGRVILAKKIASKFKKKDLVELNI